MFDYDDMSRHSDYIMMLGRFTDDEFIYVLSWRYSFNSRKNPMKIKGYEILGDKHSIFDRLIDFEKEMDVLEKITLETFDKCGNLTESECLYMKKELKK